MRYGYYNYKGERKGDFSGKEIKRLAKAGIITPETIIETEDGSKYKAVGIEGVEFGSEAAEEAQDSAISIPDAWRVSTVSVMPPKWTQWLDEVEERKQHPGKFCDHVSGTIATVHVVFIILFVESLVVMTIGLLTLGMGVTVPGASLLFSGAIQLPFIFLFRALAVSFLKSIRAAFCHHFIVERHLDRYADYVQRHSEILKYRNVEGGET